MTVEPVPAQLPSPPPSPPEARGQRQRKDGQALVPGESVIWEGSTWPCWPCCFLAPLFCSMISYTVTNKRIDKKSGCCGTSEDTMDIRRITDLKYEASSICCCCRGTVTIFSGDATDSNMAINGWSTKPLYRDLKEAWSMGKAAMGVDAGGADGV